MSEIRASAIVIAAEDSGNPLLVVRDEHGVLRPVASVTRLQNAPVVDGMLRRVERNVIVLEVER